MLSLALLLQSSPDPAQIQHMVVGDAGDSVPFSS